MLAVPVSADKDWMSDIGPKRGVLNCDVFRVSNKSATAPIYGYAIIRVPIEHSVDDDIGAANHIHSIAVPNIAHTLDVLNGYALRSTGEYLIAEDSTDLDIFRIGCPHAPRTA